MLSCRTLLGVGTILTVLGAAPAEAKLLNLNLELPDIVSQTITVDYDAGTDAFTADGAAVALEFDGAAPPDHTFTNPGSTFDLDAVIDGSGSLISGSLLISGELLTYGGLNGLMLDLTLTGFGFQNAGGDLFEFTYVVNGGLLATEFGGVGAGGGIILDAEFGSGLGVGFTGDWSSSFDNIGFLGFGLGVADTAAIPAPSALILVLGAGGLLAGRRRRR